MTRKELAKQIADEQADTYVHPDTQARERAAWLAIGEMSTQDLYDAAQAARENSARSQHCAGSSAERAVLLTRLANAPEAPNAA